MIIALLLVATLGTGPTQPAQPIGPSSTNTNHVYLPVLVRFSAACRPIPGVQYGTLNPIYPVTNPPAEQNPDLNLSMRGYKVTSKYRGLVDYGGASDPRAPQLYTLFANQRVPAFPAVYQAYDWDWGCHCRGPLLTNPEVTLIAMAVSPGEILYLPDSHYDIGNGYEALVLYAAEDRITLKYTRDDHVVYGYTIHVENVCVEPSLLALYRAADQAGRSVLPALQGGEAFGRAGVNQIGVAIRDTGRFMDPRSRKDWWQGR